MADNEKSVPLAISLPESLIEELDRLAEEVKETRSFVMRKAMRAGLPLVKNGGETIRLSGQLSDVVGRISKDFNIPRESVLAAAVAHGIYTVEDRARQGDTAGVMENVSLPNEKAGLPFHLDSMDALRADVDELKRQVAQLQKPRASRKARPGAGSK